MWRSWDTFGIQRTQFFGYWNPHCSVRTERDSDALTPPATLRSPKETKKTKKGKAAFAVSPLPLFFLLSFFSAMSLP